MLLVREPQPLAQALRVLATMTARAARRRTGSGPRSPPAACDAADRANRPISATPPRIRVQEALRPTDATTISTARRVTEELQELGPDPLARQPREAVPARARRRSSPAASGAPAAYSAWKRKKRRMRR